MVGGCWQLFDIVCFSLLSPEPGFGGVRLG
jgi:hypothetical protein